MTAPTASTSGPVDRRVLGYVLLLFAGCAVMAAILAQQPAPTEVHWLALPVLVVLLVAATWFVIPFRYGRSIDAINLLEAALLPLLIGFPPLVVVAAAVLSQVANGVLRRLPWIKTAHNTGMWALAAALAAAIIAAVDGATVSPAGVFAMLSALAVMGLVNNVSLAVVLTIVEPAAAGGPGFLALLRPTWMGSLAANAAFGLLFAFAYVATPWAAPLFFVPLLAGHLAYRNYSAARADQARLVASHAAAERLSAPIDPLAGMSDFLFAVAATFDAAVAELVLRTEDGRRIHRADCADHSYTRTTEAEDIASLEAAVAATPVPLRLSARDDGALPLLLADRSAENCLTAPLTSGERLIGAILLFDRSGFEGSHDSDLTILEGLAREASGALAKGLLLSDVMTERRKLAQIIDAATDGILTLGPDGTVLSWNPALERITGLSADQAVGRRDVAGRLQLRTGDEGVVALTRRALASLPADLYITTGDGRTRHLSCSYSDSGPERASVIVARDVTPAEERRVLQEEVSRLTKADELRRTVVEQLQHSVVPPPMQIAGSEIAAAYEPSDPREPTGGDLYDWQILPSGEIHIAVVDVLGHGVAATKDALAVVHTLRAVIAAGTPLGDTVARADELLRSQHANLVATVLVVRYDPRNGQLLVASGGHPPPMIVTPRREVRQVAASGGVIGWPGAGSDGVTTTRLEPGDALVLYTDGLVEARKNILDGIEDLERHAAEVASLPAAELAEELVTRALDGADRRDDTLALVLRRDLVAAPLRRTAWTVAPHAAAAQGLRRSLTAWLDVQGVVPDDVLLVAAELLSNAVRAARTKVTMHVRFADGSIVLDVSDDGTAAPDIARQGIRLPAGESERGRGLFIVRSISTHVDVLATAEGTTVRATVPAVLKAPGHRQPPVPPTGGTPIELDASA